MARNKVSNGTGNGSGGAGTEDDEFHLKMSSRFVVMCLLACTLLAYAVGRTARVLLIEGPQEKLLAFHRHGGSSLSSQQQQLGDDRVMRLPNPVLKNKPVPNTIYTSMNFDTARSSSINSRWVVVEGDIITDSPQGTNSNKTCNGSKTEFIAILIEESYQRFIIIKRHICSL